MALTDFRRLRVVGVTGLEPVTLRLSSACSNQLSYTPARRQSRAGGAEEIRTPDILLAKQTLYQLSYVPCAAHGSNGIPPAKENNGR